MSEILIGTNPDKPQIVGSVDFAKAIEEKARQLPIPSGYRILCAIPEVEQKFEGSDLVKPDDLVKKDEITDCP